MTSLTAIYRNCSQRGECRLWNGATSQGGYPFIYLPELYASGTRRNGMKSARVVVWELAKKSPAVDRKIVMKCRNRTCLWHGHMEAMTFAQAQQFARDGGSYSSMHRRIACVINARKNSTLTMEKAREIRRRVASACPLERTQIVRLIAAEFDLNRSTVDQVLRGARWAEGLAPNSSVFSMRA